MTHHESRLPGRPDARAASRSSPSSGCADPLAGLLMVVAEVALAALLAIWFGLRHWAGAAGPPATAPATDGTPTVVVSVFAAAAALAAVALLRARWHWAGGMQVVVALALGAAALASLVEGSGQEPPAPAPSYRSPPCLSGGDSDECARSGG
ncbi:DUF6234 family protein [Streptomyces sp. V2I9]|uniref:DUF6234 family protein n=1 Tax=Streptomyces sp. V2I9 TaxID=3042304 RepID=UPI0027D91944|nr:DUF6234 family protein [Streptomyces sp. V2I9]